MKLRNNGAYLEIILATVFLGFSGTLARWAALPSAAMVFVRTAVPSLILGLWLLFRKGPRSRFSWWLVLASTINAVRMLMFFEGYRLTSLGNAAIALYTWPVFALIFGVLILKERFTRRDVILVGLAFVGMIVVYSGADFSLEDSDFLGMSMMLGSGLLYSLSLILIRREKRDRLTATFWQNIVSVVVFLPFFIGALGQEPLESWAWAGLNGLLIGTLAFALVFSAFNRIPAAVVGHISYLEVIFAFVWGFVFFQEAVSWRHLVGGGLIIVSMIIRGELIRRESSL